MNSSQMPSEEPSVISLIIKSVMDLKSIGQTWPYAYN